MHPGAHDASVDAELLLGIAIGVLVASGLAFAVLASVLWDSCATALYTLVGGALLSVSGAYVYWLQQEVSRQRHTRADVSGALRDPTTTWPHFFSQLGTLLALFALFARVHSDRPSRDGDRAMQCYPLNTLFCALTGPAVLVGCVFFAKRFRLCGGYPY
ncbi:unnamed protein product [Phaeothamnion confervicola]